MGIVFNYPMNSIAGQSVLAHKSGEAAIFQPAEPAFGGGPERAVRIESKIVVDRAFVEDLPLNGRSFQTLVMLTPGVVVTQTAFDDQGQFSVNGQRADANYFTVNGVSANFGVTSYGPLVQAAGGALPALSARSRIQTSTGAILTSIFVTHLPLA